MKKHPKKLIVCLIVCIGLIACISVMASAGFFYSLEEMADMNAYKKTAKENAVAYIEEKYGFTPSVLDADCEKVKMPTFSIETSAADPTPPATGYVYVKLRNEEENKTFWVYATGKMESTEECWDNYQYQEIEQALQEQVEALLGTMPEHIAFAYGVSGDVGRNVGEDSKLDNEYGLVHIYFDGSNLTEILEKADYNKMIVCLVGEDYLPESLEFDAGESNEEGVCEGILSENHKLVQAFGANLLCRFLNFRDHEAYEIVHQEGCTLNIANEYLGSFSGSHVKDWCFYIQDTYDVKGTENGEISTSYAKYEVKQFADFYYVMMGGTYCRFEDANDTISSPSNWNCGIMPDATRIYDAYLVDSDAKEIYLFIPISALNLDEAVVAKLENKQLGIVEEYKYEDKEKENGWGYKYGMENLEIVRDAADGEQYLTASFYIHEFKKDMMFSVLTDKKYTK